VHLSRADGRQRVWRRQGKRYAEACVLQYNPWGGGSIHVWGGITCNNKTRLVVFDRNVNAQVYVNQVLADVVVPFMQNNFPHGDGTLQQDGARPHPARVTQQFLAQHNINVLEWAAMSPDMSPIEHLWDELKRHVYARAKPPTNVNQLREAVIEEWENIPQQLISNLVRSIRRRCISLINANGGFTQY